MLQETCLVDVGVHTVGVREGELLDDIVEGGRVVWCVVCGVVGVEGRNHVQAIEPHLVGVCRAMPETAFRVARVGLELAS